MIVKELIELLQAQDPDTRVVVSGYEGGFSDVKGLDVSQSNDSYWVGGEESGDWICETLVGYQMGIQSDMDTVGLSLDVN